MADDCFKSGPNFNFVINYLLHYAQFIVLDELLGSVSAIRANESEIYKFDVGSFAAKSVYKSKMGQDIWGQEVVVSNKYHSDGKEELKPKSAPVFPKGQCCRIAIFC